jgi:hypothetical protein
MSIRVIESANTTYLIDHIAYTYDFTTQISTITVSTIAITWGFARILSVTLVTSKSSTLRYITTKNMMHKYNHVLYSSKRVI